MRFTTQQLFHTWRPAPVARFLPGIAHKAGADALVQRDGLLIDGKVNPAIDLSVKLAGSMAALSSKLRLCQSSRTRPESASLKKVMSAGRKPWDCDPEIEQYFS